MFNVVSYHRRRRAAVRGGRLHAVSRLGQLVHHSARADRRRRRHGIASSTTGRNLNLFVILVGIVRLMLGGGIL